MGSPTKIQAIALLSPRNTPIYVRSFPPSSELRYHYLAHAGLDVLEERSQPKNSESYLGLLYTLEDLAVYGYQTAARVKMLVMISLSDSMVRDIDILTMFRAIYTAFLRLTANPFLTLPTKGDREAGLPINCRTVRSQRFNRDVDRIAGV